MSLLDRLPHTCSIKRRKRPTLGSMGDSKDDFTVLAENVSCWRQQASNREVQWWQARNEEVSNKFFFADNPNVDAECVIEHLGDRFDVISGATPDSGAGLGVVWRVMVRWIGQAT